MHSLGAGNLTEAVKLPPGEDKNEWLAFHCVHFYTSVSAHDANATADVRDTNQETDRHEQWRGGAKVIDVLTPVRSGFSTTGQASAGPKFKFLYKDNKQVRVISCCAP